MSDSASTLVGGGDHELLRPGTYEYTVELSIPESAPPSIKGNLSRVEYNFSVQVDIPVKIDWKKTIKLAGRESTVVDSHRDSSVHQIKLGKIDAPNMIAGPSVHEFEILIPPITVPHSQAGKNFAVTWNFEAQLHIPWASDPVIGVPVTLLPK